MNRHNPGRGGKSERKELNKKTEAGEEHSTQAFSGDELLFT